MILGFRDSLGFRNGLHFRNGLRCRLHRLGYCSGSCTRLLLYGSLNRRKLFHAGLRRSDCG